jgi:hypothetical protein
MLTAFILVLIALPNAPGSNARAQEVINRFESDVQVTKDGTLLVTETIHVRAEGRSIKRGI